MLAVLTLLACFAMFYYFIDLSSKVAHSWSRMKAAALEVSQLTQQMRQLPPEKTAQYAKAQDDLVLAQKVWTTPVRCRMPSGTAKRHQGFHFVYSWRVVIRGDDHSGLLLWQFQQQCAKTEVLKAIDAKRIE